MSPPFYLLQYILRCILSLMKLFLKIPYIIRRRTATIERKLEKYEAHQRTD